MNFFIFSNNFLEEDSVQIKLHTFLGLPTDLRFAVTDMQLDLCLAVKDFRLN